MSKCIGCGVELQNSNSDDLGYTKDLSFNLCERCFRIRNYNDYKFVIKDNNDFISILNDINKTKELVVLVVDLFNISSNLEVIKKYLTNDILLVLTKRDILPKSCYDKKLIEYFSNYNLNIIDTIIISSTKNYNFDILYDKINAHKKSNKVYVVGFTNAGKSTMINKILYNYSNTDTKITTSSLPSTTIDTISVKVDDSLELIDTPGLLDYGDIINYVDNKTLKCIVPNKEIKPMTYQVKDKQIMVIDGMIRLDVENVNLTFYMSNKLKIKRIYKNTDELLNLKKHELDVKKGQDLVIQGLGFINVSNDCKIVLYIDEKVSVYTRKELI